MHRKVHFFIAHKKVFLVTSELSMGKKGILFLLLACFIAVGYANGAVRSGLNSARETGLSTSSRTSARISVRPKTQNTTQRSAITTSSVSRSATTQSVAPKTKTRQITSSRSGLLSLPNSTKRIVSRVATNTSTAQTLGSEYEACRDAYFTCMDQFCATVDETYRRCICSSRLNEIKQKQSALSQTSDSLANFHDFNLDIIDKSAEEVQAMTSATAGEQIAASSKDDSDSAKQLTAISDVLAKTKSKSLSTAGTLDAGGDIKAIWNTTDLASGANIANLTGESLYNAVNAQCSEMMTSVCPASILDMVISAYGMYIENDCATMSTDLSKKKNSANSTIRETGREMAVARLANYDAHNSLSINDCISSVRKDLTSNTACGPDFVHCLDVTGLYLNIDTGEPIYSSNFYNLANQISLSGNILNNQTNHMVVNALNTKKVFAKNSLDKCRDLSGDIWDEFMRQAIIEIHQRQQEKIRNVKTECLSVVNQCYDEQTNSLKDFSSVKDNTLLGLTMETVEDLCSEKLNTCSNLYGGGPEGLATLVNTMRDIVDQRIVAECQNSLIEFGNNLCAVQSTDTIHAYPYACRVYSPGDQKYAAISECNAATATNANCGTDYIGSLYQRFVNYAMQVCIRPSEYENLAKTTDTVSTVEVPTLVLQDINIVMDKMRISMGQELSKECERFGGIWVTTPYTDTSIALQEQFYNETGTNKLWGYCKLPTTAAPTYIVTFAAADGSTSTAVVTYGEIMQNVNKPTKDGCTFNGYFTATSGGIKYYDQNGYATRKWDIAENTTLYAQWINCSSNSTTSGTAESGRE